MKTLLFFNADFSFLKQTGLRLKKNIRWPNSYRTYCIETK